MCVCLCVEVLSSLLSSSLSSLLSSSYGSVLRYYRPCYRRRCRRCYRRRTEEVLVLSVVLGVRVYSAVVTTV